VITAVVRRENAKQSQKIFVKRHGVPVLLRGGVLRPPMDCVRNCSAGSKAMRKEVINGSVLGLLQLFYSKLNSFQFVYPATGMLTTSLHCPTRSSPWW
jgi:hypothetical protein